ncbi:unnamed protein product [marine sediment metagenome]|uniref:Methyltransferase domain-containing protein n=1 Tax=marine sediment metagenome TaxID=412755 RepID=X0WL02_9ZZZZ
MPEDKSKDIESIRKQWNKHAGRYDRWYRTFGGALEHHMDWELLKGYLPNNRDAKILDAAGGTGRMSLPLAKMGYSVTLVDISPGMLDVAREKMLKEGVSDKVNILECDARALPFPDESFDFALCWGAGLEVKKELTRVTTKGGKISMCLMSKWAYAIDNFYKDPAAALT